MANDEVPLKPVLVESGTIPTKSQSSRKIGFFDKLIYRLFYWRWTPILKNNPTLAHNLGKHMQGWAEQESRRLQNTPTLSRYPLKDSSKPTPRVSPKSRVKLTRIK